MKYKIGDTVEINGIRGRIEKADVNNKIGFLEENNREAVYTIVFENVPESKIFVKNGTDTKDSEKPKKKKGKSA